jgi:hypothetical protein
VERGEPDGPLTRAWEAVRWSGDGGEGGGGRDSGAERARARRVGNERSDECGEEGRAPHPFIGSEGERWWQHQCRPSGSVGRGNRGVIGE